MRKDILRQPLYYSIRRQSYSQTLDEKDILTGYTIEEAEAKEAEEEAARIAEEERIAAEQEAARIAEEERIQAVISRNNIWNGYII